MPKLQPKDNNSYQLEKKRKACSTKSLEWAFNEFIRLSAASFRSDKGLFSKTDRGYISACGCFAPNRISKLCKISQIEGLLIWIRASNCGRTPYHASSVMQERPSFMLAATSGNSPYLKRQVRRFSISCCTLALWYGEIRTRRKHNIHKEVSERCRGHGENLLLYWPPPLSSVAHSFHKAVYCSDRVFFCTYCHDKLGVVPWCFIARG